MDSEWDEGSGCAFVMLKHIWYVTSVILRSYDRSSIDVALTYFGFLISVSRLC